MQKVHNNFVLVEPTEHKTFLEGENPSYEEIGTVLDLDETINKLKIGDKVFFDSWTCRKYPVLGEEGKFHWLVPYDQIVFSESDDPK